MRSKRVCDSILGEVLMLLGMIIQHRQSINVWVNSSCFWSDCIIIWVDLVVHFSAICRGKRADWTCMMGIISIILADRGVARLNFCWGYGGVGGKGWCVACFGGVLM